MNILSDWIYWIIIAVLIIWIMTLRFKVKVKNIVIDNQCKNIHDLLQGKVEEVKASMLKDITLAKKYWRTLNEKNIL